jgi:ketosteroid isomerase-like protein
MATRDHVQAVEDAFSAALSGDVEAVSHLLAEDVRWYGAGGDPDSGCTNREQALGWIGETIARGIRAKVLDVRQLDADRVLIRLQRLAPDDGDETPDPHAQLVTFRGDKVAEIVVYPSEADALAAVGGD